MLPWQVTLTKRAAKELRNLPKEIIEIMAQLYSDFETDGPAPKGWVTKRLKGKKDIFSARLKREYRAIYEMTERSIVILSIGHRKDVYDYGT